MPSSCYEYKIKMDKIRYKNILALDSKQCCGCRSCEQSCPHGAIMMHDNGEGFLYPSVDEELCTQCGLCIKKCPKLSDKNESLTGQLAIAVWLKKEEVLFKSTSGGAFAGFAESVLQDSGLVFGAAYDNNLSLRHISVQSGDELWRLKGSKYVESDIGSTFRDAKSLLDDGKKILYSGTPCQVAGLKSFLGKEYRNLLTVDLICHGVPSRKLFSKWLEWKGKKTGGKIIYCGFRDKDIGGSVCLDGRVKTKTKTKTVRSMLDPYYASFIRCETYRESCYTCPYSSIRHRLADISIGDFHELKRIPKYADKPYDLKKGVSLVIVNTEKGRRFFESVKDKFDGFPVEFEDFMEIKSNVKNPSPRPEVRNHIYDGINNTDANVFFRKYKEAKALYPIQFYSRKYIRRVLSLIVPRPIKEKIKNEIRKFK